MRGQSRGWARSVDRGTCRRSIEPRNIWKSGCRRCLFGGKATLVGATSRAPTGPARSKTSDMHGTSTRENRETLPMPDTKLWAGRSRKVMSHNLDMNVGRESDRGVLPAKCPNKGGRSSPAEGMEGRPLTKDNTRLEDLHSRVHRGTYRALPSKRAYILKQDGRQRPLGIAALEEEQSTML